MRVTFYKLVLAIFKARINLLLSVWLWAKRRSEILSNKKLKRSRKND